MRTALQAWQAKHVCFFTLACFDMHCLLVLFGVVLWYGCLLESCYGMLKAYSGESHCSSCKARASSAE
jgi:hypothetical protein